MYWLIVFPCLIHSVISGDPESRTVHLNQGIVRGYKDLREDIFAFYGIPYATAPKGPDRYKAPLSPPIWSEPFDAVEENIICPQASTWKLLAKEVDMRENCLIANIFVPNTNEINLPVVVYVHGGAYIMGWGNAFTYKKLVNSKKVIVVTFNYRLGAHGFLCLGTKDVPGNAGMKDQVALLRWVKANIAQFGGDPDEVTIAGYSAGSSSVDLLMISKMAQGLFKRVIPESGANTASFSVQRNPIENAKEFAKMLNFNDVDDFYALENFYKTVSYDELAAPDLMSRTDSTFVFSPCVERDVGEEIFLDDDPVDILKSGNYKKVPMLYGFAQMEGLFRLPLFELWKDQMKEKFSVFLPADLHFRDDSEKDEVAKEIRNFYFGNNLEKDKTVLAYIDYFTDTIFAYPTLRSVKLHVQNGHNDIYLYEYSFVSDDNPVIPYTNNIRGADHCAQTFAILDGHWAGNGTVSEESLTAHYKQMKASLREIWLNFITTGKPLNADSKLTWPPVESDWTPHMSINKILELRGSLLKERTQFWEGIYNKYYRPPIAPSPPPQQKTEL
ncbi:cholinesterase 1-like [Melitaea cinxia]|uniref:cholinesterase 1-like n=1 Tax=Melitaea cinxia TaxID=113334 RepID=UPI001E2700CF|nr:cholinesterase 1-like [Melitaea cinxia]